LRVLVVYGSSRGGTAGLAQMVAEALAAHGIDADVGDATGIDEIDAYDAVIVGGALYHGRWHADATWFVERNFDRLRAINVWFFSSGPLDDTARSGSLAPVGQVQDLARRADIRSHMTFGGMFEAKSTGLLASLLAWGKPGDFRDPQHVTEWVEHIVARLGEPRTTVVLPELEPEAGGVASRVLRRLATAGEEADDDNADDYGLDVLLDSGAAPSPATGSVLDQD
jgi:menaquinone-dependent protoporphyrinogen oxidase